MASDVARIVALGASNLARGFRVVVSVARAAWGPDVQVVAALGRGRSYGAPSSFFAMRRLPSILESGLWRDLQSLPPTPTRALVTDVGNDILYGYPAEQTLAWVDEAVSRLQRLTDDIILTDLPVASAGRLTPARFLFFRSIFVPSCRLSLDQVLRTAEKVDSGLKRLSAERGVKLCRQQPAWYGLDPIHIRVSARRSAWGEILGARAAARDGRGSLLEGLRLFLMPEERRWLLGIEQYTPQRGVALPAGGRVWLY
jgi:hypothetical protein